MNKLKKLNEKEPITDIITRLINEADNGLDSDVSAVDAVLFRIDQYGLNQRQFAEIIGMTESSFSEFMNGKRKLTRKAVKRCIAIGVSVKPLVYEL